MSDKKVIEVVNAFNRKIKLLTLDLNNKFPNDAKINRAYRRILLAIDTDPIFVLNNVGAYLYKYRDKIVEGNDTFFITNDYDEDIKAGKVEEKQKEVQYIMPKIKEAWKIETKENKDKYKETVKELLMDYAQYAVSTRKPKVGAKTSTNASSKNTK